MHKIDLCTRGHMIELPLSNALPPFNPYIFSSGSFVCTHYGIIGIGVRLFKGMEFPDHQEKKHMQWGRFKYTQLLVPGQGFLHPTQRCQTYSGKASTGCQNDSCCPPALKSPLNEMERGLL